MKTFVAALTITLTGCSLGAREYHVSAIGLDSNTGSKSKPFKTISAAAQVAKPGDVITVREGIYRERINPPRGGTSDGKRITYRAAKGESVIIKGSERITGWERVKNDTWKVAIPNTFFGEFNPFRDHIHGDWFTSKGRVQHTGAVYLNGHWLTEATTLDEVLKPAGRHPLWFTDDASTPPQLRNLGFLLDILWIKPGAKASGPARIAADSFVPQVGVRTAPSSEGGKCIGWIKDGDSVTYERVDFGKDTKQISVRCASGTAGGWIEIHSDGPAGELLGICAVPNTGGWETWKTFDTSIKAISGQKTICLVFRGSKPVISKKPKKTKPETSIWAQFKDVDPNKENVEIDVRQSVFYPEKPGMNYITVRGFTMEHAATPWAPPTAEQIGLIGTHWSKGWIIEDNTIRYSTCAGVTLGKYGDEWDNRSELTDEAYKRTIERALKNGWSKENIGSHIVRNNHISHCEQAGIVGSLGAVFSTIKNNEIHDIHVRRLFTGAEMAGIKIHGSIDMLISGNYIHHTCRGIWLDWMAQGTRVTGNLLHDNGETSDWAACDLFVEVSHGPFLVDHNIFLSRTFLCDWSEGGAYVHNLARGRVEAGLAGRKTPFLKAHSTKVAGLHNIPGGDDRFFNNVFVQGSTLAPYEKFADSVHMDGNVFLGSKARLIRKAEGIYLELPLDESSSRRKQRPLVTSGLLGRTKISNQPFEQPDGTPYRLDTDYFGKKRITDNPAPGPFAVQQEKALSVKVWPREPLEKEKQNN